MRYSVLLLTILLVSLWSVPVCEAQTAVCGTVAGGAAEAVDLIVVVDSSSGMGDPDFRTTLQFLSDLKLYFRITFSPINGVRAAGVVFDGSTANLAFGFQVSVRKLQTEILAMQYLGGAGRDMTQAIKLLTSSPIPSDRASVPNVALIVTNGPSLNSANAIAAALTAYNGGNGIDILTIGITNGVDSNELIQISSPPRVANQNYYFVNSFADLSSSTFQESVARGVCARRTPAPTTTTTPGLPPTTTTTTTTTTSATTTSTTTTTTPITTTTPSMAPPITTTTTSTTSSVTTTMTPFFENHILIISLAVGIPLVLLLLLLLVLLLFSCHRDSCAGCCAGCCDEAVESHCGTMYCCACSAGCLTGCCSACFWSEDRKQKYSVVYQPDKEGQTPEMV